MFINDTVSSKGVVFIPVFIYKGQLFRFSPLEETTVCAPPQLFVPDRTPTAPLFDEYLQRGGRDKNRAVMQRNDHTDTQVIA